MKRELKENSNKNSKYIKVTPNKTYRVYNTWDTSHENNGDYETDRGVGNFRETIIGGHGVPTDPDYYYREEYPIIIAWSNEINKHTTTNSADWY